MLGDDGLHVVVADVDGEQPERADVARVRRHEGARQVEDVHQPAGQQRAGAAERGEREVADVEALGDGHLAQRVGLVPRGDLQDAGGRALQREVELRAELLEAVARRLDRQRDLPAQQVRRDPAERDVFAGELHRARGRLHQPADALEQRRLAGAVRAEQRDDLVLAHAEVDVEQDLHRPVGHVDARAR